MKMSLKENLLEKIDFKILVAGLAVQISFFSLIIFYGYTQNIKVWQKQIDTLPSAIITLSDDIERVIPINELTNNSTSETNDIKVDTSWENKLYDKTSKQWKPKHSGDKTVFDVFAKENAYPVDAPKDASKISIILITDETTSVNDISNAQEQLSNAFTYAYSPYKRSANNLSITSFQNGFESWMTLPVQPQNFPYSDSGPLSLLEEQSESEALNVLEKIVSKAPYVVGLITNNVSPVLSDQEKQKTLAQYLSKSGMGLISHNNSLQAQKKFNNYIPYYYFDGRIDRNVRSQDILSALSELEKTAKETGFAIGYARHYPETINALKQWQETLSDKNIQLVTASQLVKGSFAQQVDPISAVSPIDN